LLPVRSSHPDPEETEISTGFTVHDYEVARNKQDHDRIAEAIRSRFTDRYVRPVADPKHRHGFTMMAISCLMIEAIESFQRGWKTSDGHSCDAFCSFLDRAEPLKVFRGYGREFYENVRCGILHQGETTGGWKVVRLDFNTTLSEVILCQ
jgi:hypothetical protein